MRLLKRILGFMGLPVFKATKCGHFTKNKGFVSAFGETITTKMPVQSDGSYEWCLSCIEKMAIKCAWCNKGIMIGDIVTVSAIDSHPHLHKNLVFVKEETEALLGCLRESCGLASEAGGRWIPGEDGHGKVGSLL